MKRLILKRHIIFSAAVLVSFLCVSVQAQQEPEKINEYGDWSAYVFAEGGNKVCYMVSQPKSHQGDYTKRGDIFALVTHRPADNSKNVFSYIAGYTYQQDSEVTVNIGNQNFALFTQGESAWTPDQATDNKLAAAIKRGNSIVVKGVSSRGTKTTDTFGLKGSSAAYKAISDACGIK